MPNISRFSRYFNHKSFGFTLVELIIAVSIIALLAIVGTASYRNVSKDSTDAKRKADIDTIAKAYEEQTFDKTTGIYKPLNPQNFANGELPRSPDNKAYSGLIDSGISSDFTICAPLNNHPENTCNTPSDTCYCRSSSQGSLITFRGEGLYTPTPTNTPTPTHTSTPTATPTETNTPVPPPPPPPPPDDPPACSGGKTCYGADCPGSSPVSSGGCPDGSWQLCGLCSPQSCSEHWTPGWRSNC